MLSSNHCEVITLSDDDTFEHGNAGKQQNQQLVNIISPANMEQQDLDQLQHWNIPKRVVSNGTKLTVHQHQSHPRQLQQRSGVTMAIMNERPLDMKRLLAPSVRNPPHAPPPHAPPPPPPLAHPLPPPTSATMTVKEQLILYFQQQQKMQIQHDLVKVETAMATTTKTMSSAVCAKENGHPFPFINNKYNNTRNNNNNNNHGNSNNNILKRDLKRSVPEWRQQSNASSFLATLKQLQRSGNIQMTPQQVPTRTMPKRPHADMPSMFCNTYVEAHNKRTMAGFGVVEEDFSGQFQCTFQSCNKRLKNNVMFIYHIWAHVVQQKPMESEEQFTNLHLLMVEQQQQKNANSTAGMADEQRSDVSRLHTCTECLLEAPTPYRARLHFHRVHKRGARPLLDNKHELHVCNICEQVIDARALLQHIIGHHLPNKPSQLALPYGCRFSAGVKCQFRTSNRGALIRHFCTKHVGTHVVLCPFCLLTFSVPPADKRGSLVRMREFVRHMTLHDGEKTRPCPHCVIRVAFSQRSLMDQHQEQHAKLNGEQKWLQWQMQRLDLNCVLPDKSRALISSDMSIQQCAECGQMVHNLSRHIGKEKRHCTFCAFVTSCAHAMDRHRLLAQCNPANAARTPFAGWASSSLYTASPSSSSLSLLFGCTLCSTFRSVNVQTMAKHIATVHHNPAFCGAPRVRLLRHNNAGGLGRSGSRKEQPLIKQIRLNGGGGAGETELRQQQQLNSIIEQQLEQYSRDVIKEEMHEAELFGLRRMADAPLEPEGVMYDYITNNNDGGGKRRLQQQQQNNQQQFPTTASSTAATASSTTTTIGGGERAAMRDWLATFLPMMHANTLSQRNNQPLQKRLLAEMMATDRHQQQKNRNNTNNNGMTFIQRQQQLELRIRMGLMLDNFPSVGPAMISAVEKPCCDVPKCEMTDDQSPDAH